MLNTLKLFLGIADTSRDELLKVIIADAQAQLKRRLGGIEPPAEMDDIIRNVAIKRYNRIGSEGLTSHTVEGETQSFAESDFDEYSDDIQAFLSKQNESTRGRVRFI